MKLQWGRIVEFELTAEVFEDFEDLGDSEVEVEVEDPEEPRQLNLEF